MNIIKCNKGHIYDADKFSACPHCSNMKAGIHIDDYLGEYQQQIPTVITRNTETDDYDLNKRRKTVGFLVCIKGEMLGEGFLLREGMNDIGRASNMHVVLADEPTVSRKRHACITFDSEKGTFTLYVDPDRGDIFCNGVQVKDSCQLENRALIQIGECVLSFMAFCDSSFTWYTTEG